MLDVAFVWSRFLLMYYRILEECSNPKAAKESKLDAPQCLVEKSKILCEGRGGGGAVFDSRY